MAEFEEPLFGCFSDLLPCLIVCCVPLGACFISAFTVDKATGEGKLVPFVLPCLLSCIGFAINRGKIRATYKINGSFLADCLCSMLCNICSVTQEYREVIKREAQ